MSRRAPGAKSALEGPGGRQAARRAQGDQKGAEFRVAKRRQAAWISPTRQEQVFVTSGSCPVGRTARLLSVDSFFGGGGGGRGGAHMR